MDVLRRELDEIYEAQRVADDLPDDDSARRAINEVEAVARATGVCAVLTDVLRDRSTFVGGSCGAMLGLNVDVGERMELASSDEDFIYCRMHPEDLVDLRMLEYQFFKYVHEAPVADKTAYKAIGRIRMRGAGDKYVVIEKSTQVLSLTPRGNLWLVLCLYAASPIVELQSGITPTIINNVTGEVSLLSFVEKRSRLLTVREKEILAFIRNGLLSKEIAGKLGISINTVNRHRQNILEKLSVDNSIEAVNAALAMRLL